jgi:hypothetical protein
MSARLCHSGEDLLLLRRGIGAKALPDEPDRIGAV